MPTIQVPAPLDHQIEVLQADARFKVVVCGRRWGKSVLGLIAVLTGHGPGRKFKGAIDGKVGMWVAPIAEQAADIWRALKASLRGAWVEKNEVSKRIVLPGGGIISVRSADNPDSLRGVGLDFLVIDEAATVAEEAWTEVLRATLADKRGWVVFIGTPKGQGNWFYDLYERAASQGNWARWQRPSADNPKMTPEELQSIQAATSNYVWQQEYLAEFVSPGIGLFKRIHAKRYRIECEEYVFDDESHYRWQDMTRFATVDTATSLKTSADFSAIAVWGADSRGRLSLLDLDLRRMEGPEIMRSIVAMCEQWECFAFVEVNSTSKHLLSFMQSERIPFRELDPGAQDKWNRAQEAAGMWEKGKIVIPESTAGWRRDFLGAFERQVFGFSPNSEGHDDAVDCMAYAARVYRVELGTGDGIPGLPSLAGSKRGDYLPPGLSGKRPHGF